MSQSILNCCRAPLAGGSASKDAEMATYPTSQGQRANEALKQVKQGTAKYAHKWGFCCVFFVYLAAMPFLFVCLYHHCPMTVLLLVTLLMLCSLLPMLVNQGDRVVKERLGPMLSAGMLACLVFAFICSVRLYYAHVQPLQALRTARSYQKVYPQEPSVGFPDAGYLSFAGNTKVDVKKSVSLKSLDTGFDTYCVAPVSNGTGTGRVEFWAVGTNCCGDKGDSFTCDDALKENAKNGWVLPDPHDDLFNWVGKYVAPAVRRDLFMQAVVKAEHSKQLTSDEHPVFVRWTSRSRHDIINGEMRSVAIELFVALAFSGVMAYGLAKVAAKFAQVRREYKFQRFGEAGMATAERLNVFVQNMHQSDVLGLAEVRKPMNLVWDTWFMAIAIPYVVLMLCMLSTTYGGCFKNSHLVTAPFMTILWITILALLATPKRKVSGVCLLLAASVGLFIGSENYKNNMVHYCAAEDRRSYSNVAADTNSVSYSDAGIMNFDSSAQLSQKYSVGFKFQDVEYCAAPIISHPACVEAEKPKPSAKPESGATAKKIKAKKAAASDSKAEKATANKVKSKNIKKPQAKAFLELPSFLQLKAKAHMLHAGHLSLDVDRAASAVALMDSSGKDESATDDYGSMLQETVEVDENSTAPNLPVCKKGILPTRVEFWAIGTDCCGCWGDFHCDGGKDVKAQAGVVVQDTVNGQSLDYRKHFDKAIAKSVAAYGLPDPKRTVFIRWGKDAKGLQQEWSTKAFGMIFFTGIVGLLCILCMGLCSHMFLKSNRIKEKKEMARDAETLAGSQTKPPPMPASSSQDPA